MFTTRKITRNINGEPSPERPRVFVDYKPTGNSGHTHRLVHAVNGNGFDLTDGTLWEERKKRVTNLYVMKDRKLIRVQKTK